ARLLLRRPVAASSSAPWRARGPHLPRQAQDTHHNRATRLHPQLAQVPRRGQREGRQAPAKARSCFSWATGLSSALLLASASSREERGNKMKAGKRLFCFGCGYSARVFARRFAAQGGSVAGTGRTEEKVADLRAAGIEAFIFAGDKPLPEEALKGTTHLLISTPPGEGGDPVLAAHQDILRKLVPAIEWAGYLSTTGVYGDRKGGWVSEDTPLDPAVARSDRRAAAEAAWTTFARASGLPLHIFRLAGIYGPGRNQLKSVLEGTARRIVKEGQVFSRIHVE